MCTFYQTNNEILKFEYPKHVNEIIFNHYICRKENIERTKGELPRGQFYLAINTTSKDLNLTTGIVRGLIKRFIDLGIITNIYKPSKGKNDPSIYAYNSVLIDINNGINNDKHNNIKPLGNAINNDINNEIKKNHSESEKEIFDYWNSKNGIVKSRESTFSKNKTKISTAIKNLGRDEILKAIDNLDKAVMDNSYYYNYKWNLFNFLKQANGISNWLEDGQLYNNYLQKGEKSNGKFRQDNETNTKKGTGIDWSKFCDATEIEEIGEIDF